jgi:integrase
MVVMNHVDQTSPAALDLKVVIVVFADGERCPMLIDKVSETPLFDPNVWVLTIYRRESASVMEQALRGAMLLHLWCTYRGVNLFERVRTGTFFAPHELDSIESDASKPKRLIGVSASQAIKVDRLRPTNRRRNPRNNVRFLRRMPSAKPADAVGPDAKRLRLYYLGEYVGWLADKQSFRIARNANDHDEANRLKREHDDALEKFIESLRARMKGQGTKSLVALEPYQRIELLRVTDLDSRENPWKEPFVRLRNRVIILLLMWLGIRRGEALSSKVRHVEAALKRIQIVRNQDDKDDPRKKQPQAKTRERMLHLGPDLLALILQYIKERAKIEGSKKHGFLFVSETGKPLSLSAFTEIFAELRKRCPGVGPVTAHVLRHTANEIFSDEADEIGMDPVTERRLRIELMGWSLNSRMPEYYLQRKTRQQSAKASTKMQERAMRDADEAKKRIQEDEDLRRFLSGENL